VGVLSDIDLQPPYMTSAPKYQAMLDLACEALVVSSPSESVISSAGQLTVWPNPSEGQLTIGISGSDARPVSKVMYDLQGRPVFSDLTASATFNSQLPSGIYLLEVMMEGEQWPRLTKVILSR